MRVAAAEWTRSGTGIAAGDWQRLETYYSAQPRRGSGPVEALGKVPAAVCRGTWAFVTIDQIRCVATT